MGEGPGVGEGVGVGVAVGEGLGLGSFVADIAYAPIGRRMQAQINKISNVFLFIPYPPKDELLKFPFHFCHLIEITSSFYMNKSFSQAISV